MNPEIQFWKNSEVWPRDNASYVFLGRAVHEIGKRIFGADWTGDEPCLDPMATLPVLPVSSGGHAYFAHDLLVKYHPEFGRLKRRGPVSSFKFTGKEWEAARAIVAKDHAIKMPGVKRFSQVQERIVGLAEAGHLITALRQRAGGDPSPISRALWNSERTKNRFVLCQMNPHDPFGVGFAGDGYQLIFVTRESLTYCLSSEHRERGDIGAAPASFPAEDRDKSRRPIAAAKVEPEFVRWRELQKSGYIPTVAEDITHMKAFGVSRATVRQLRKKFPRRQRGQKKLS